MMDEKIYSKEQEIGLFDRIIRSSRPQIIVWQPALFFVLFIFLMDDLLSLPANNIF